MNPLQSGHHITRIDIHYPPEANASQTDIFAGEEDWMPETPEQKKSRIAAKITDAKWVFTDKDPETAVERTPLNTDNMEDLTDVYKELDARKKERERGFVDLNIDPKNFPKDENIGNPEPGVLDNLKSAAKENVEYYKDKARENAAYYGDQAREVAANAPENLRYYGDKAKEYTSQALYTAAQTIAAYVAVPLQKVGEAFQSASRNLEDYSQTPSGTPPTPRTPETPEES